MKTKGFMTMAAATLMLVACNNEKAENGATPLRLSSNVEVQTRALNPVGLQDTQIAATQPVHVWVEKTAIGNAELYKNNVLTADGSGNFTPVTNMFFPEDGGNVDIYAIHGKFSTIFTADESFPAMKEYEVATDQRADAEITNSDLLFATNKNVSRTSDDVQLTFYHMLSKMQIALKIGAGSPTLASSNAVFLEDVQLKGNFSPNKGADMATQTERAQMLSAATPGLIGNVQMKQALSPDFGANVVYNEAILAPQDLSGKTLTIKLNDGGTLSYTFPASTVLVSGKKYVYHITLNLSGLTVTSSVANWDSMTPVTGDAGMEDNTVI